MLRSHSRVLPVAAIVAAALAVAACDSSPSSSNTSSSGTTASTSGTHSGGGNTATSSTASGSGSHSGGGNTATSSTASGSGSHSGTSPTTPYSSSKATVIGDSTDVVVNPAVSTALKQAGITVTAVAPATGRSTLLFPVSSGQMVIATLAGTVHHAGGLTFSHSGKTVTLANLIINTNTEQFTATIGGQSMPIFDLNLASPTPASDGTVVASNIKLTETPQAATALNSSLGVSTFKAGMDFGTATLTVAYARGHR